LDNNTAIRTITLYGNSLKKLYKYLPEDRIKAVPEESADVPVYDLEVNIGGVVFTGKDDSSSIVITSSNRSCSRDEVTALQEIASKCYTYPFGDIGFVFGLNITSGGTGEKELKDLLIKHRIEHSKENRDPEGRIELTISDVKDFSKPSFIDFVLELQALAN
jgi:hypothetical protein